MNPTKGYDEASDTNIPHGDSVHLEHPYRLLLPRAQRSSHLSQTVSQNTTSVFLIKDGEFACFLCTISVPTVDLANCFVGEFSHSNYNALQAPQQGPLSKCIKNNQPEDVNNTDASPVNNTILKAWSSPPRKDVPQHPHEYKYTPPAVSKATHQYLHLAVPHDLGYEYGNPRYRGAGFTNGTLPSQRPLQNMPNTGCADFAGGLGYFGGLNAPSNTQNPDYYQDLAADGYDSAQHEHYQHQSRKIALGVQASLDVIGNFNNNYIDPALQDHPGNYRHLQISTSIDGDNVSRNVTSEAALPGRRKAVRIRSAEAAETGRTKHTLPSSSRSLTRKRTNSERQKTTEKKKKLITLSYSKEQS